MERLAELISKLKEQFDKGADPSKLLGITLLIERELMKLESSQTPAVSSSKVSVVMPAARNGYQQPVTIAVAEEEPIAPLKPATTAGKEEDIKDEPPVFVETPEVQKEEEPAYVKSSVDEVQKEEPAYVKTSAGEKEYTPEFFFDPLTEIPTLSQQHTVKEINEMLGIRDASLNDKLKEYKVEIGHKLTEHPIKDLKKAININDRYVFINELFRGDEVMYERSLKTINSFRIYAEAEYWIERELKVKLGWLEHNEATKQFYQLVKRRFS